MLFEISGIKESSAQQAMHLASYKLPIATRFVVKEGASSGGQS
jgi:ribosomal protein L16/L10AE